MKKTLKTKFDKDGYIEDNKLSREFYDFVEEFDINYTFSEQEIKIEGLKFSKNVPYASYYWSGDPDDVTPSYRISRQEEHMNSYTEDIEPTQQDICEFFNKEPYEITKEDLETADEEIFREYLEEKYYEKLYDKAYDMFYNSDVD